MTNLPSLPTITGREAPSAADQLDQPIVLKDMDYNLARSVPGAIYSSEHKSMILPVATARSAIVALALAPGLANNHPELVELRDSQTQTVHIHDYATALQIPIDAPVVHQKLLDDGHDWLRFDQQVNRQVDGYWPNQNTDLGYAAAIMERHGAAALGWSRGYGKTLGTAAIVEANAYKSVLVASPNTVKFDTWHRELAHFLPSHQVLILGNTPAKRERALARAQELHLAGTPFVLVVHHEALALIAGTKERASGKGKQVLNGWTKLHIRWDLFAFDESHRLKSAGTNGSQLHRAACKVPSIHRLALTGSVYENSWEELYGQLHWMFPQRYHSQWDDWNLRFFDYVEGYSKIMVGILPGREEAMGEELGVFFLIREKMPRVTENRVMVQLTPAQQQAYEDFVEYLLAKLSDGTTVIGQAGVVELTRLRQIADGLGTLSADVQDSSKIDAALKLVRQHPDDDFFFSTWYKAVAYNLRDRLAALGHTVYVITGDVPIAQRGGIIAKARADAEGGQRTIVIGTIPTLGESVNLQFLNHVVRLARSFNPALNRQVVDRVDRTGQKREPKLTDIIAEGTVDELVVMPNLANKDAGRALLLGRGA